MSRVVAFLRSLGVEGAARNARLLLEERSQEREAVKALTATMARFERPPSAPPRRKPATPAAITAAA